MSELDLRPGPRHAQFAYRPCVGIMLFNASGHVFVGQRIDQMVEAWQMPQGGVDPGEAPRDAAFRELKEEIGTNTASIVSETVDWLAYDLPPHLQGKIWKGKYRGQIQKWYLMRFDGTDSDVNIETAHPEFRAWRWSRLETLVAMAVPFKQGIYSEIVRRFGPKIARQTGQN
ncbi:MAG: RNA pyrophosphohydrolase [Pseudomonadota bacterium]